MSDLTLHRWIRTRATECGWNSRDVARVLGVRHRTAKSWLTGQRRPRPEAFRRLLTALQIRDGAEVVAWRLYAEAA